MLRFIFRNDIKGEKMTHEDIFVEDMNRILASCDDALHTLMGKSVLVTGATGLIGSTLVNALCAFAWACTANEAEPPHVYALVRNEAKAEAMFAGIPEEILTIVVSDISDTDIADKFADLDVNYIVHAASMTSSRDFVSRPVDVINTAISGTFNMLELARNKKCEGFIYTSTMEVYGAPETDEKIFESSATNLDTMSVRSSYPESKRVCESLCASYASQYGVPAKVLRLTQTFGPGVRYDDGRVFAEFARCAIEKRDIVLHTKGETCRSYLYTADAAAAILTVLAFGEVGEAYNAANEETYCSIYEMAQMVANECAAGDITVRIEAEDASKFGYAPVLHMNLDTFKLRSLGWEAAVGLKDQFDRMICCM
jgi:nucleoside-diphosphate-sugar epimerase